MADVKWIKLSVGLPDSMKLKQIRTLPNGDTIALMWVFLMCLAGNINDRGMVYFTPEIPFTDEMLAEQFRMDVNTVRLALNTFQRFGMIEIIDNMICLAAWEKWQSVDKLADLREYNRIAQQKSRAKRKQLQENNFVNDRSMTSQPSQGTDKEEDKEKEVDKETYISIVEYLNQRVGANYRASTKKTQSLIHARLKEGFTLEDFQTVIDKKAKEWLTTEYEQYLRPETLFGNKFESYLNANIRKPQANRQQGYYKQTKAEELEDFYNMAKEWAES